ncbi:MAG TPA: hypothetical protein VGB21_03020 [Candidatus Methylomirabilis sp.]
MSDVRKPLMLGLMILLLLLIVPPRSLAGTAGCSCAYDGKTKGWALRAQGVPVQVLLSTLAARAGFELVGSLPATGPKVSLQCQEARLDQILGVILKRGQCSYSLVYRGDRLQRLILLGPTPGEGSSAGPQVGAEEGGEAPRDSGPGASVEGLLRSTHHPDPERRRSAFQALAPLQGEAEVHQRLQEGLSDPDPEVREQVLSLLGPGAAPPPPNPYPEQIPEGEEE